MENAGHHHLSHNLNLLVIAACWNHGAPNLSWDSFHGSDSAEISKSIYSLSFLLGGLAFAQLENSSIIDSKKKNLT
jgi:hypothetical protein